MPWIVVAITLGDTPQRAYHASGRGLGVAVISAPFTFVCITVLRLLARDATESRLFVAEKACRG